jgi:hypothetical protein
LALWQIARAIDGVAASIEWEKTSRQTDCRRWTQSQIPPKN